MTAPTTAGILNKISNLERVIAEYQRKEIKELTDKVKEMEKREFVKMENELEMYKMEEKRRFQRIENDLKNISYNSGFQRGIQEGQGNIHHIQRHSEGIRRFIKNE